MFSKLIQQDQDQVLMIQMPKLGQQERDKLQSMQDRALDDSRFVAHSGATTR